ncbi:uncharacterized protein LOC143540298 [Bidens hawaiensis]|uniref:uncharacterized protein LOC143540298 n=1 Tax=Bidens hawaiensis TaxID=980011 RepID=UPI0040499A82
MKRLLFAYIIGITLKDLEKLTSVPLYEASIRCDWKAAKAVLDTEPGLERCGITENWETALHVAASAKADPKDMKEFGTNLVELVGENGLELQNENCNTALYLAAAAGNLEIVKIMVDKNRVLLTIQGAKGVMHPLYAAVLFGNYDVAKYLYEESKELLNGHGWTDEKRGWLLERCVENDMFDIALEILKKHPKLKVGRVLFWLGSQKHLIKNDLTTLRNVLDDTHQEAGDGSVPEVKHPEADDGSAPEDRHPESGGGGAPEEKHFEAGDESAPEEKHSESGDGSAPEELHPEAPVEKHPEASNGSAHEENHPEAGNGNAPEASSETKFFACIGLKVGAPQKESNALPLLRFIWDEIAKKPKNEIDEILRGTADSIRPDNKTDSGWAIQAMQLQTLIFEHVDKMKVGTTTENHVELQHLISQHLVEMHAETQKIIKAPPNLIKQDNQPVSSKEDQALELQNLIFKHIAEMHDETQNKIKRNISLEDQLASELRVVIVKYIDKMHEETNKILRKLRAEKNTYSSRVLFIAAEMGNTNFLVELIRQYPDLIWKVNDHRLSIFHIAVKHRHQGIYNLLYEIGAMKDLITCISDSKENNNMLHLVGKIVKQKRLEDVSGVALQMQRELLWFQEVKNMIPPSYRERKNKDGLTPYELFRIEHKELVTKGEKWMKGTANRCMVVAALIATIVFAAAYTVPGGYSQGNGIPYFHSKATFMIFVVADAISLFLSSASILIFLSILTSRYAESDFLESLPRKLILGLLTLFLSIATMMVAFGVSFFVLYHKGLLWMSILICALAVSPVILYIWLQYGLFFDVIRSTYLSRYLFKPGKHVLYYKNPRV